MIDRAEIEAIAGLFGAPDTQIIRDHLISHVLAAIADWPDSNRVTFFGGTALCRTWLPNLHLSEDIDLLVDSPADGDGLRTHITSRLRREFPSLAWTRLGSLHQVETWTLADDDLEVKVQLARRPEWQAIPVVIERVQLRYSDLSPSVDLRVPTPRDRTPAKRRISIPGPAGRELVPWSRGGHNSSVIAGYPQGSDGTGRPC